MEDDLYQAQRLRTLLSYVEWTLVQSRHVDPDGDTLGAATVILEGVRDDLRQRLTSAHAAPALPCIVCDKPLANVEPHWPNQPYDGVHFTSPGNDGSAVFNPHGNYYVDDREFLEVNICDDCLRQKAGAVLHGYRDRTTRTLRSGAWDPDAPWYPRQ